MPGLALSMLLTQLAIGRTITWWNCECLWPLSGRPVAPSGKLREWIVRPSGTLLAAAGSDSP